VTSATSDTSTRRSRQSNGNGNDNGNGGRRVRHDMLASRRHRHKHGYRGQHGGAANDAKAKAKARIMYLGAMLAAQGDDKGAAAVGRMLSEGDGDARNKRDVVKPRSECFMSMKRRLISVVAGLSACWARMHADG
jgi:hypothetical protein